MLRFRRDHNLRFPERRRHIRIVTLRNFCILLVAFTLFFAAVHIRSELRGLSPRDYGRLLERQFEPDVERKPVEVVREAPAPVDDQSAADPMLVAPLASEQWLQEGTSTPEPATPEVVAPAQGHARVAIVGGSEGVTIVRETQRRPVLSGGFGRPRD